MTTAHDPHDIIGQHRRARRRASDRDYTTTIRHIARRLSAGRQVRARLRCFFGVAGIVLSISTKPGWPLRIAAFTFNCPCSDAVDELLDTLAERLTTARPRDWWPLIARTARNIIHLYYPHRRRCRS